MTYEKTHMDFINNSIDEIEMELFLRSRQYDTQIKRITTATGITELSALFILSEIGADMSVFESDIICVPKLGLPLQIMRISILTITKPEKVTLTLDNTLLFLSEQGADQETLKLIQQQCAA